LFSTSSGNCWLIVSGFPLSFFSHLEACKENKAEIRKVKKENIAIKAKLSEMETDIRKFKNERK
jgi:hypothetical protein